MELTRAKGNTLTSLQDEGQVNKDQMKPIRVGQTTTVTRTLRKDKYHKNKTRNTTSKPKLWLYEQRWQKHSSQDETEHSGFTIPAFYSHVHALQDFKGQILKLVAE